LLLQRLLFAILAYRSGLGASFGITGLGLSLSSFGVLGRFFGLLLTAELR